MQPAADTCTMPPSLTNFNEDDILAPEAADMPASRKRRASEDLTEGDTKRQCSSKQASNANASVDHYLDKAFGLILDESDDLVSERTAKKVVSCLNGVDDLSNVVQNPLRSLVSAALKRCSNRGEVAVQRLLESLSKAFSERLLHELAQGLTDTMGGALGTKSLQLSAGANGYKLELKLTPVLSLEESDNEIMNGRPPTKKKGKRKQRKAAIQAKTVPAEDAILPDVRAWRQEGQPQGQVGPQPLPGMDHFQLGVVGCNGWRQQ